MKAVVDIGTNTVRMLIGEVQQGKVKVHAQFIKEPRLGIGITKGYLNSEAVERTITALEEYKKIILDYGIKEVSVVATSAVRDAKNKIDFVDDVLRRTGWQVDVISGEKEAELSYIGAVASVTIPFGLPVVLDIGGGSTEVIFAQGGQIKGTSVRVGAVRFFETAWSEEELNRNLLPLFRYFINIKEKISLIVVGGTATTVAAIHLGIKEYSREAIQGQVLTIENILNLRKRLEDLPLSERKKIIGLTPKRADIIIPGLKILLNIVESFGETSITVSDAGILDGLLLTK